MSVVWLLMSIINAIFWLLPSPADKLGWGLRVRTLNLHQPFLAREYVHSGAVEVALINQTKNVREHMPHDVAIRTRDLVVTIVQPDGNPLDANGTKYKPDKLMERRKLLAGNIASSIIELYKMGYEEFLEPGGYELRASLKTNEGVIVAPVVNLLVIEPAPTDVLESKPVLCEGEQVKWPKQKQERGVVQQIKIGDRTWLFYRKYASPADGGKVSNAFRIAELPGKVLDMKVEGAFGDWNPLTITYREHTYSKFTTTHIINSVDGRPWTAEEEKHRQEKLKGKSLPEKK